MLLVLSQIEPSHHIFSKQHTKLIMKKADIYQELAFNAPSRFFNGLVIPKKSCKIGRNLTGFIEKLTIQKVKLSNMQRNMQKFREKLDQRNNLVRQMYVEGEDDDNSDEN